MAFFNTPWCGILSVTSLANDNFVITGSGYGQVYARIFYSNGTAFGNQFLVNSNNVNGQSAISPNSTNSFLVFWQSGSDIYGQIFTNFGAKIGNAFTINTFIINHSATPSITSLVNDNYIVTWQSYNQVLNVVGIYGQILDSAGNKIGTEFNLNTITTNNQQNPSVASLVNTNFVVVCNSQDNNGSGVFGNIYQIDGSIIGFNTCTPNCQSCDNSTNCKACDPNFNPQIDGLCGCFDGFYLYNISLCISKFIRFPIII